MKGLPGFHDLREEILERAWTLSEGGGATIATFLALDDEADVRAKLGALEAAGLVARDGERVLLTPRGSEVARHVVRAHRLAARLLSDLLDMPPGEIENMACRLEHAISQELADSLCTLLGHPPTAPGGEPIPRGRCCQATRRDVQPLIRPLVDLDMGSRGRITLIHPRFPGRLDVLSSLGLVPGTDVRLTQRYPSVVVEVGETTLALDTDVARDVFVKPLG